MPKFDINIVTQSKSARKTKLQTAKSGVVEKQPVDLIKTIRKCFVNLGSQIDIDSSKKTNSANSALKQSEASHTKPHSLRQCRVNIDKLPLSSGSDLNKPQRRARVIVDSVESNKSAQTKIIKEVAKAQTSIAAPSTLNSRISGRLAPKKKSLQKKTVNTEINDLRSNDSKQTKSGALRQCRVNIARHPPNSASNGAKILQENNNKKGSLIDDTVEPSTSKAFLEQTERMTQQKSQTPIATSLKPCHSAVVPKLKMTRSVAKATLNVPNIICVAPPASTSTVYGLRQTKKSSTRKKTVNSEKTCFENKENQQSNIIDAGRVPSLSSKVKSTRNLATRTDVIEQLLLSDDEMETNAIVKTPKKAKETMPTTSLNQISNKGLKFFHYKNSTALDRNANKITKKTAVKSKAAVKSNKNTPSTSKRETCVDNIFEFESKSLDVDDKNDPAADIIEKKIKEGKVCVTTNYKGRLKIKRNKKPIEVPEPIQIQKEIPTDNVRPMPVLDDIDEYDANDNEYELPEEKNTIQENVFASKTLNPNQAADGSFSSLARSVILKQAQETDQRKKLLDAARKLISTPYNRTIPPPHEHNMSPIFPQPNKPQMGNASPWRIDDEAHLPSVFHFSRNSHNLPSFTSDIIPATPRKERNTNSTKTQKSVLRPLNWEPSTSFSSNDSNAENIPPVKGTSPTLQSEESRENISTVTDHTDIFNVHQVSIPNRTNQQYRTPLKDILVTDVVMLQPWKTNIGAASIRRQNDKSDKLDLFGFEEFLSEEVEEQQTAQDNARMLNETPLQHSSEKHNENNQRLLREKLNELKKFYPSPGNQTSCRALEPQPIAQIFDEDGRPKQRSIKKMLCSTMIKPAHQKLYENKFTEIAHTQDDHPRELVDRPDLFNDPDPDPEPISKKKDAVRTYVRPKRKRQLHYNYHDYEHYSEDEDLEEHSPNKKKRQRKEAKPSVELESFVQEFNEMCKDVETYNLVVE